MLVVCLSHLQLIPDVLWPPNQQLTTLHVFAFAHLSHYHTSGYICLPIWTLKWENGQWNKQHKALLQWKKEENSVVFFELHQFWKFGSKPSIKGDGSREKERVHTLVSLGCTSLCWLGSLIHLKNTVDFSCLHQREERCSFLTGPCLFGLKQFGFKLKTRKTSLV